MLDERNAEIPDIHSYPVDSPLSNIVLTSEEDESVLKSLPVGKAVWPDGINSRVLKELSREISPALCGFFNQSLHTGIITDSFKQAYVSPVHKGGDPSEISNYRPISLLSNLDKAFEPLIFKMYIITSWKTTFLLLFSLDSEGETLLLINYLIYITLSVKLKMQVKK